MTTEASQTGMFFSTYSRKTLIFRQCTFSISARIKKGKKIKMIGLDIAKGSYRFRRLGPQLTSDGIILQMMLCADLCQNVNIHKK